jgi:hypothetical protein
MNFVDYVYAHIYSWYQKMVENGRKVNPQGLTSMFTPLLVFFLQV